MSLLSLAFAYVWHRRLVSLLTVSSIALAVALIVGVLEVRAQAERGLLAQAQKVDLVVGASGSETALVLSALFYADQPRGNIPYRILAELGRLDGVTAVYPISLGDRFRASAIVGTTPDFFQQQLNGLPVFPFAEGGAFDAELELVVGAGAARRYRIKVGDRLVGSHAGADALAEHAEFPYQVVGILAATGTPADRALYTSIESYWHIHHEAEGDGAEKEVTAILVQASKPRLFALVARIRDAFGVAVVRPAEVLSRLFVQVLEPAERILLLYGYAVLAVAAASVLTTLYLATLARQRDLAVLRALGAYRSEVFGVVLAEAAVLLVMGTGLGVLLSQLVLVWFRSGFEARLGIGLTVFQFQLRDAVAVLVIFGLGLAAALLPAWHAYRGDVARQLARG